ncbi:FtsX-like permease family protein [uncultured Senegalimassilia sp.]|uniref:FtsX-like permease family protein n=1 Tax=uncultured Senegalimassilia sp. TaxID=1714350 RepID=UPI0025CE993B|nr:FtsX-like permease family protein [uncultured Senegalimassilia sp.]
MGAFRKEVLRSITHSWGRFLAIAVMAALGCGFYAGLRMTGPDMRLAGDEYYDATELCDLRVVSSLGMSDEQVDMLRGVEGVSGVMPAYEADAISQLAGTQYTLRYHSLDMDAAKASSCDDGLHVDSDNADYVNRPILVEGTWPESDDECLLSADNVWTSPVHIGDTVELLEGTQDLDGVFTTHTFIVTGFVRSSYYTCTTNTGATSLGSGELSSFVFVPEGAFAADYPYTEAFLTVDGAAGEAWPEDAYQQRVDAVAQRLNDLSPQFSASRIEQLQRDAQAELDDKRAEFEREKADAVAQMDDAQAQLDDASAQLDSAAAQLSSAAARLSSSQAQLAQGEAEIASGRAQHESGTAQLAEQREQAQSAIAQAQAQLDAAQAQYDQAMAQRSQLETQLEQARAAQLADVAAQLEAAIAQIDAQTAGASDQIAAGRAELDAQREQAAAQLSAAQAQLDAAQAQLDDAAARLASGRAQYAAGQQSYEQGRAEYESGLAEQRSGQSELDGRRAEAQQRFADAEQQLADAQAEIDAIADKDANVYVLDRSKNLGAESFRSDAGRMDQIAAVFPLMFFLVAALVSLTTMTRMVEEERVLIGTYKALGYSNARITSKYLVYAVVASGVGAAVGIALLSQFLPWFIMKAYSIMYMVPCMPTPVNPGVAASAAALGVGITVAATWFAAAATLRECPASLMLPRAPKAGKRILLERIRPLWSRMTFSWKVTARNLFRYKRRFFMAIIGIAGCTALLLTGLGLQNAINDIIDKQYGEVYSFNTIVRMDADEADQKAKDAVSNAVGSDGQQFVWVSTENKIACAPDDGAEHRFELVCAQDPEQLQRFVQMRERVGGRALTLDGSGAIISEKLASQLGVSVGDTLTFYDEDDIGNLVGDGRAVTVAGIMENYVAQYAYVTADVYKQAMGQPAEFATVYADLGNGVDRDAFSDQLLSMDGVKTVTYSDETIDSYRTMLKSVNSVVVVLVVAAALLAFVVLYNLTNINITERAREIATLKVLGFTSREVDAYIFRETILLSIIGAAIGLVLGIFMEGFVITTAEVDQVMFGRDIHAASFAIAFALTMVFSGIVALAMRGKLRRIDMVESLKSNE